MNRVLSDKLYKSLKDVKISKPHKLPVLNYAKLEFLNGELIITTTDLEEIFISRVPCIVEEEFSTCVPMLIEVTGKWSYNCNSRKSTRKFYPFIGFVKVCAEYKDVLEFSFNAGTQILTIKVQGERSVTEFKCIHTDKFPAIPEQAYK